MAASVYSFVTVASLRTQTTAFVNNDQANLAGYYARGDKGGGLFYYDAASTATDNGGTIIKQTSVTGAGRWIRQYDSGEINVCWFGVTPGDLSGGSPITRADNATRFNNAIAICGDRVTDGWEFYNSAKVNVPRASEPYELALTLKCNKPSDSYSGAQNVYICCEEIGGAELEFFPPATANPDYDSATFVDLNYLMYFRANMGIATACGAYNLTIKSGGILVEGITSEDPAEITGHVGAIRFVEVRIVDTVEKALYFTRMGPTANALIERCYFDRCELGVYIESPGLSAGTINKCRFTTIKQSALTLNCSGYYVTDCEFAEIGTDTEGDSTGAFIHLPSKQEDGSSDIRISGCRFGSEDVIIDEVLYRHADYAIVLGDFGVYNDEDAPLLSENVRLDNNSFFGINVYTEEGVPRPKAAFYLNGPTSCWFIDNNIFRHYSDAVVEENFIAATNDAPVGGNNWGFNNYDPKNVFVKTFSQGGVGWQSAEKMYGRDVFVKDSITAANILSSPDNLGDSRWVVSSYGTKGTASVALPDGSIGSVDVMKRTAVGSCYISNDDTLAVSGPLTFGVWLQGSEGCQIARIGIGLQIGVGIDDVRFLNDPDCPVYLDGRWRFYTINIPNITIPLPAPGNPPTPVSPVVRIYANTADAAFPLGGPNQEILIWRPMLWNTYETPELATFAPAAAGAGVFRDHALWQSLALGDNYLEYGTAAPSGGYHRQGDYCHNTAPVEAGTTGSKYIIKGWICVTSGTSGTWLQERILTGN
jgi:hypothetical protein